MGVKSAIFFLPIIVIFAPLIYYGMKKLYFIVFMILLSLGLKAQNVSLMEAEKAAQSFLNQQQRSVTSCARVFTSGTDTLLYIFNSDHSFVVVSGDKRVPPILAFSDHQLYNDADIAAPAQMWIDNYTQEIAMLKTSGYRGLEHASWQKLLCQRDAVQDTLVVAPLMQSHWGQGTNYSYYCPRDYSGENGRCVTGCVATAMAQLIYYYRFPQTGTGSYSYVDEHYGLQYADYENTTYDYDAMLDEPTSINTAISTLMHHCGVGVDMVYGPDGSGMYNHSAARVLRTYFKYSPETEYLFRDSTSLNWDSVIVSHLDRRIPMYYAGWSLPNINGHGFICDGYRIVDGCYFFHFNFGWDGSSDGYFYTNHLNLGGSHFNLSQELIVNAFPDTANYNFPVVHPAVGAKLMTTPAGSDVVGGGYLQCPNNMDYTWTIRPEMENLSDITFDADFDLASGDTLYVSTNEPGAETCVFTDTLGNLHFSSACTEIVVRLVTDNDQPSNNVRMCYNAHNVSYCSGTKVFTASAGSFNDGSDDENYGSFSNCVYKIIVPSYSAITLNISNLDLETGRDFLYIFDNKLDSAQLLTTLTGTIADTTIVYDKKRLAILFESDETGTAGGFDVNYTAGYVGVDEANASLYVYPNPAHDVIYVENESPIERVAIMDMMGRVITSYTVQDLRCQINISNIPAGVYVMQLMLNDQIISKKIVKQ